MGSPTSNPIGQSNPSNVIGAGGGSQLKLPPIVIGGEAKTSGRGGTGRDGQDDEEGRCQTQWPGFT